jgi:hypothetical protein
MFRLAVADPESGVISINVSALSRHRFGSTLHASLEAFVYGSPIDYLHQMSRMDDSEERAFNIVYYSTLIHELRHFFDFLITPYGAFDLRTTMNACQMLLGLMGAGEPLIIPFILGSDPFFAKHVLGLENFENSPACKVGRIFRNRQEIFKGDKTGYRHENGRTIRFGGSAMLEALAFNFQRTFLNFSTLRTPNLEKMFPAGFSEFDGKNPTNVDIMYRWFAPFQHMISKSPNEAVAKILHIIVFASLCGRYRSGVRGNFLRDISNLNLPVFSLGPELPSQMFQTLLGRIIDQFEDKALDRNTTWDDAWNIVDQSFLKEYGRSIIGSIAFDLEEDEYLAASMPDGWPSEDHSIEHIYVWYRSLTALRRRVFDRFRARPANFVDPLAQLTLFGPEFPAPIEMVYPHSTNIVFPGSEPVDSEILPLPSFITDQIRLIDSDKGGAEVVEKPVLHERVYYWSTLFKGDGQWTEQELASWKSMSSFFRPFLKTLLYSHDPHVVVGRMSKMIIDSLLTSKVKVNLANNANKVFEVESPEAYFNFHQLEKCACDLCLNQFPHTKEDLRSVSSLTLRGTDRFQDLLETEKDTLEGYLRLRDWSEYRLCRDCFRLYFPDRAWQ